MGQESIVRFAVGKPTSEFNRFVPYRRALTEIVFDEVVHHLRGPGVKYSHYGNSTGNLYYGFDNLVTADVESDHYALYAELGAYVKGRFVAYEVVARLRLVQEMRFLNEEEMPDPDGPLGLVGWEHFKYLASQPQEVAPQSGTPSMKMRYTRDRVARAAQLAKEQQLDWWTFDIDKPVRMSPRYKDAKTQRAYEAALENGVQFTPPDAQPEVHPWLASPVEIMPVSYSAVSAQGDATMEDTPESASVDAWEDLALPQPAENHMAEEYG